MYSKWITPTYNSELYHFGIKGMKWGVRRYQNKDGSLTPEGRNRISKIYEKNKPYLYTDYGPSRKRVLDAGVQDKGSYSVIKKGQKIGRVSSSENESMEGRKYIYVTDHDKEAYKNFAVSGKLGANSAKWYGYELTAKRDLKVASGKEVVDHILKEYGNEKTSSAYKTFSETKSMAPGLDARYLRAANSADRKFVEHVTNGRLAVNSLLNDTFMKDVKKRDAVFEHFKSLGYDAIEDVEDNGQAGLYGMDFPVIVFDSKETLKKKNITEF